MTLELSSDLGFRTALVCGGFILLAALAATARIVAPNGGNTRPALLSIVPSAFAYLALGLGTRFVIQHHKSRLQMLVLLIVVASVETARLRPRTVSIRCQTWLAGSITVCLGVLAAKWVLEPGALSAAFERLRDHLPD